MRAAEKGLRVGVYMAPDLLQRLQQVARKKRTSVSEICRAGALRELEKAETPPATTTAAE